MRKYSMGKKALRVLRYQGPGALFRKIGKKLFTRDLEYESWREKNTPSEEELSEQRRAWEEGTLQKLAEEKGLSKPPMISIVIPFYHTPEDFRQELYESLNAQTYPNFERCFSEVETDISSNTNLALQKVRGDLVAFMDHDDLLSPDAFYEVAMAYLSDPTRDFFYSDEDKVSMDGYLYFEPHLKPDFNLALLESTNYICHLVVVSRELLERVGMLNSDFNGAQDYDFVLRCAEQAKSVHHIKKILYHWRTHKDSTAKNVESKTYAYEAGQRALEAHFARIGRKAVVSGTIVPGIYRSDLSGNFRIRLCDGGTGGEKLSVPSVGVLRHRGGSGKEIAALGMDRCEDYLFFWDERYRLLVQNVDGTEDDSEEDMIRRLLFYVSQPGVTAAGAVICDENMLIRSAGGVAPEDQTELPWRYEVKIETEAGGALIHSFRNTDITEYGYMNRLLCAREVRSLPFTCLLVKRADMEQGRKGRRISVPFAFAVKKPGE